LFSSLTLGKELAEAFQSSRLSQLGASSFFGSLRHESHSHRRQLRAITALTPEADVSVWKLAEASVAK
jgi:hypothetical protein